jgi:hypothetical protein
VATIVYELRMFSPGTGGSTRTRWSVKMRQFTCASDRPYRRHGSDRASSGKTEAFQSRLRISSGPFVERFAQGSA